MLRDSLILFFKRIFLIAVNDEFTEKKFEHEVTYHSNSKDNIFVHTIALRYAAEPSGKRSENGIEAKHLCHCNGNVSGGFKGEAAVEREVPDNRKKKRNKI